MDLRGLLVISSGTRSLLPVSPQRSSWCEPFGCNAVRGSLPVDCAGRIRDRSHGGGPSTDRRCDRGLAILVDVVGGAEDARPHRDARRAGGVPRGCTAGLGHSESRLSRGSSACETCGRQRREGAIRDDPGRRLGRPPSDDRALESLQLREPGVAPDPGDGRIRPPSCVDLADHGRARVPRGHRRPDGGSGS